LRPADPASAAAGALWGEIGGVGGGGGGGGEGRGGGVAARRNRLACVGEEEGVEVEEQGGRCMGA
jgi:hypothetical protein